MKKSFSFFMLLVVVAVAAFAVMPAYAQGETPVGDAQPAPLTLPDALQGLIAVGIGFLVTQGIKAIFVKSGADLSGVAAQVTGGLVTSAIAFGNFLLSLVPAVYVEPASVVLMLVISIFGVFGLHYSYAKLKPKA